MQLVNFRIDPGFTSLISRDACFDLHNNFKLGPLFHDVPRKVVELVFFRVEGDWVPKDCPDALRLSFNNVSQLFEADDDADYPAEFLETDRNTLDMIGFSYAGDEIMNGVTDNNPGSRLPAMLFVFVTGKAMKIVADSAELYVD